jgi:hypothetical protein
MEFARYEYEDVTARAGEDGLSLAEQIRLWEQNELRQMEQEHGNTFLGADELWHHLDHLSRGLA